MTDLSPSRRKQSRFGFAGHRVDVGLQFDGDVLRGGRRRRSRRQADLELENGVWVRLD